MDCPLHGIYCPLYGYHGQSAFAHLASTSSVCQWRTIAILSISTVPSLSEDISKIGASIDADQCRTSHRAVGSWGIDCAGDYLPTQIWAGTSLLVCHDYCQVLASGWPFRVKM